MNIKIISHLMPWEIDYALLQFSKLKKASEYISSEDKIFFEVALNLSNHLIDWKSSKIPKQFFIDKFSVLVSLLNNWAEPRVTIYEGDGLWGHLDLQRGQIESHIDYYISICPDMWFHEHLLFYLIEGAKRCEDKYFIITPETTKLWDWTWDELVHNSYKNVPYEQWDKSDVFEVQRRLETLDTPFLEQVSSFKWAGWFDLYSKEVVEELITVPDEWRGYGPWDTFGMIICDIARRGGTPVREYVLRNQIICEYFPDKTTKNNFADYYKSMLVLNKIENQRQLIESSFPYQIEKWKNDHKQVWNKNNQQ